MFGKVWNAFKWLSAKASYIPTAAGLAFFFFVGLNAWVAKKAAAAKGMAASVGHRIWEFDRPLVENFGESVGALWELTRDSALLVLTPAFNAVAPAIDSAVPGVGTAMATFFNTVSTNNAVSLWEDVPIPKPAGP